MDISCWFRGSVTSNAFLLFFVLQLQKCIYHTGFEISQIPCTEDGAKDCKISWNYPHSVGTCDEKHRVMQNPKNTGSMFFNYKETFGIVLTQTIILFSYANIDCQELLTELFFEKRHFIRKETYNYLIRNHFLVVTNYHLM